MVEHQTGGFVAECYWPDVNEHDVRYPGSILRNENEVVLCQFEGTADAVRQVVTRAEVPFERILETTTYRAERGNEPCPAD